MQRTKSTRNGSVRARGFSLRELLFWNDHMSRTKMTVARAKSSRDHNRKSNRNRSRKYDVMASPPPVADDLVETRSIPKFSEADKILVQQKLGLGKLYLTLLSFSLIEMDVQV